uniref:Invertebrate defensins family profile domain-containing protein n=1 Tax=Mayetiola destructor TaxID=39758 RepID=Q2QKD5_MAYDE|nr:hypothetical protein [Mayetiola destructor]
MNCKLFFFFVVVLFFGTIFNATPVEAVTCASQGGPAGCRPYCILNGYKSGYCNSKGNCACTK